MLQLLESYRSLTLKYMADAFGVREDYMDSELCRYTPHLVSSQVHAFSSEGPILQLSRYAPLAPKDHAFTSAGIMLDI